jgi:ABC-type Zn uptake system ZnuABC Zn-binding protein ZnuA
VKSSGREVLPIISIILLLCIALAIGFKDPAVVAQAQEKPIIVCTTNVLGSIVEEFLGGQVEVVVLSQPSICPADYDMKPGDIYAVSRAKLLFYHEIPGEQWLKQLISASENEELILVKIPGPWNTPEGAKQYIQWTGGNLSKYLGVDLKDKMEAMISAVDEVAEEIRGEAEVLGVENIKVISMSWQTIFVKWVGFHVVAEYGSPEMLSAGFVANLTKTAEMEGVALIIDNLQVGVDFGEALASDVGAYHVVLTNFPGAIPRTGSLAEMFKYNARQLFDGVRAWRMVQGSEERVKDLENQVALYQVIAAIALLLVMVEAVWIYMRKNIKPRREAET